MGRHKCTKNARKRDRSLLDRSHCGSIITVTQARISSFLLVFLLVSSTARFSRSSRLTVSLPGINPVAYFSPRQQPEGFRKYFARLLSTRPERIKITTITAFASNIKQFGKAVVGTVQKRAREARRLLVTSAMRFVGTTNNPISIQ